MAGKFIDIKDAAALLGITADELIEMRSRGEIFGYRDGSSWKFKQEEVDRVISEMHSGGKSSVMLGGGEVDDLLKLDDDVPGEDSVLLTEDKAAGPPSSKRSTVIGDEKQGRGPSDSDLRLGGSSKGGDVSALGSGGAPLAGDSIIGSITLDGTKKTGSSSGGKANALFDENNSDALMSPGSMSGSMSGSVSLDDLGNISGIGEGSMGESEGGSSKKNPKISLPKKKSDSDVLGDGDLLLGPAQSGVSGVSGLGSEVGGGSVDLDLNASGLNLGEASVSGTIDSVMDSAAGMSDMEDGMGSVLDDDDEDIELDGNASRVGSDVTHGAGDSGIGIRSPSDSGLSLEEEPLDLGGSAVDPLELPEDDDVIALDDEAADPDMATQLKADEAFSLSPVEGGGDEESDSGSQVIALEDSAAFEEHANLMKQGEPALMADDFGEGMQGYQGAMAGGAVMYAPQPVEAPYSVWNVLGLACTASVLAVCGMLMWDVMLNMWSFTESTSISTSLMDSIVASVGMNK